ncbi:protein-L-isoaspartate(D-aspartate) O-methyltransferase [Streptomyces ipomoeae]|uniref:Protein-L-isoaspartate(D-aspartate) O-methyltransferase (PCMT) n=2 Tax=Streptomyces ipomoeae TaxID=103232 RepID=L1KUY1_9ACTN|nr:protein-L-isoaspartate(D-aspartate) O-methyltransferase (PCMT) [Streptomyces ipomoeae]EKX64442.1 protein-L-isoaspartate(D-aspartate) O-methyltransferase (PCMT) [Streptomyces ipomoeae 91-03]MDX2699611.1 protein-L-isoaspartate(D-aspartate) O-methyltransferase [Streptomyces ipomoeae]MDX2845267.1 protein-L-isoaspartate(D-aspartate) O-methyltransferase [Streptomyces ipomoeae]TQE34755.1 protein-L-isoaspartate(D-aspartate) O-methyltransferase [Streptomyces ipomoeae]TQE36524.1 protein-L-isoaspartat
MDWETHARRMAADVVRPESRWYEPLGNTPRHLFVPRWWARGAEAWELRDGPSDPEAWMRAVYANKTLVTRVGPAHADSAFPGAKVANGYPTSSSTLPGLVVTMYRHAMIADDSRVLVTTGTGYGTALLCRRVGDELVTSVDVDTHLVMTAGARLDSIGLRPRMVVCDITGPLPGEYDRIVSTVSVRPVPASWLSALQPGGRLVTTLAGTGLIVTADKTEDGGAVGRVEPDPAGFMRTRHGDDYERGTDELWEKVKDADGENVSTSRYPLLYVPDSWDVMSMLELLVPGIEYRKGGEGEERTVWMLHPDGSWARATATGFLNSPTVHQGGPRRLWDELERIRNRLNREGALPVYGALVRIDPDGTLTLSRGAWSVTMK